ncbi:hypothetical protein QR680_001005 [Steinernema hermaphroditum]|uniref:Cyclin-dependent kinase inhibitor domain-containing protein n=1 Tax=Steinernema hermaphroditum TaxID=289476 RepID=A0AA39GWM3_9BILA|nr:hypothetical protein QR680_001005 [Steinernema hermaphroditum]
MARYVSASFSAVGFQFLCVCSVDANYLFLPTLPFSRPYHPRPISVGNFGRPSRFSDSTNIMLSSCIPATPRKRLFHQESAVDDSTKAKRRLFSASADADVEDYVQRELFEMQQEKQKKWNFDFAKGCPLPSSSEDSYTFSSVPESDVPSFYRSRHDSGFDSSFDAENKNPDSENSSNDEATFSSVKRARKCIPAKRRVQSTSTPKKESNKKMTEFMPLRRKISSSPKDASRRRSLTTPAVSSPLSSQ